MPKIVVTESLGQKFKRLRTDNFIKSIDLCKLIEKSPSYITKLERGDVADIDINAIAKMINYIVGNNPEKFNKALDNMLEDVSTIFSEEEINEKLWRQNFDMVLREIPIPPRLVDFINEKISDNGLELVDLIKKINENEDLRSNEYIQSNYNILPRNHWFDSREGSDRTSMIVNLNYNEVLDILSKEKDTCKYYVLQAILYHIYRQEKMEPEKASIESINKLTELKFLSLSEKNKLALKASSSKEFQSLICDIDADNIKVINRILKHIKFLSDWHVKHTNGRLTVCENNFSEDRMLTLALMGVDLRSLKPLSIADKKKFIRDVEELVEEYSIKAKNPSPDLI